MDTVGKCPCILYPQDLGSGTKQEGTRKASCNLGGTDKCACGSVFIQVLFI